MILLVELDQTLPIEGTVIFTFVGNTKLWSTRCQLDFVRTRYCGAAVRWRLTITFFWSIRHQRQFRISVTLETSIPCSRLFLRFWLHAGVIHDHPSIWCVRFPFRLPPQERSAARHHCIVIGKGTFTRVCHDWISLVSFTICILMDAIHLAVWRNFWWLSAYYV